MDGWRCVRADCHGTLLNAGDGERCLLCGRGAANGNDYDPDPLIAALMMEPPGSITRFWVSGALAGGYRENRGRRAGGDAGSPPPRLPSEGSKAAAIWVLLDEGYRPSEVVEEGRRRQASGGLGWSEPHTWAEARRRRQWMRGR